MSSRMMMITARTPPPIYIRNLLSVLIKADTRWNKKPNVLFGVSFLVRSLVIGNRLR